MKKTDKEVTGVGIIAAVIASLCCIGPLILLALGLATASTALSIGAKSPYFLAIGLIFFAVSLFLIIKYRRKIICKGCTTKKQERERIIITILISFISLAALYILLNYVIVPWLAPIVYKVFL
ncbi:MAG: mercuric transporter MerT family protein [Actinobacteria bacterium]|nr:mercuric transporter MerT family protein [Actinomycetota bacterium]